MYVTYILQLLRRKPLLCAAWHGFSLKKTPASLSVRGRLCECFVNYLFTGMIALVSSSPTSLIELCMISREERNALIQKLLFGDWFSWNVRIADCPVAVIRVAASVWEVLQSLWELFVLNCVSEVCSCICGMRFQVCVSKHPPPVYLSTSDYHLLSQQGCHPSWRLVP